MQTLETIELLFQSFDANKKNRTFNKIACSTLGPDFSARGIFQKLKIDYYKFLQVMTNPQSEFSLINIYGEEKVKTFMSRLIEAANEDVDILKHYNELTSLPASEVPQREEKPLSQFAQQMINKSEDQEQAKEFGVQLAEKPTSPAKEVSHVDAGVKSVEVQDKKVSASLYLGIDIGTIVTDAVRQYLEGDAAGILSYVGKRIEEEALKLRPNFVKIGSLEPVQIKGKLHASFAEALFLANTEKQLFMSGPAGSGKTTLAAQLAEAFRLPFGHISCTAGMSEAHLLGRMVADGSFVSSQFIELYENGGVFLADEVDAADANTLLILNSALANGYVSVPNRKDNPVAKRHANFYMICAGNTWGAGSNEYSGREILDAAFLDRFAASKIAVEYDEQLEKEILSAYPETAAKFWKIREAVKANRIRRVVSTRVFASAARQLKNGRTEDQFLDTFFTGWTKEERAKTGL